MTDKILIDRELLERAYKALVYVENNLDCSGPSGLTDDSWMKVSEELRAVLEAKVRELEEERDRAVRDTKETCARLLELRPDDVRLMAGEVTAQELRTIMAVLSCLRTKMRSSAYVTVKEGKERDV